MSEEAKISLKELDEFATATAKALIDCAVALDVMRETLVVAASMFSSFERFYCRKCKKFFTRKELKKITSLSVPCPECEGGLVPARNIKLGNDKEGEEVKV